MVRSKNVFKKTGGPSCLKNDENMMHKWAFSRFESFHFNSGVYLNCWTVS